MTLSITNKELDDMASELRVVRKLVPLKKGEKRVGDFTAAGLEIPKGMREETDEELRKRVLGHIIA